MVLVAPESQAVGAQGVIRFAVGDPAGLRSHTWNVVSDRKTDDVYLGLRKRMSELKLSLHRERWRLALTQAAAARLLPADVDRVLHRWTPPAELAEGWRHGATIVVPTSSLRPAWPEARPKRGVVTFFPAPNQGWGLRFDVLLGAPNRDSLTVQGAGEVGRASLASGAVVWVVATEAPVDSRYEEGLAELRRGASAQTDRIDAEQPVGWAWGDGENGGPVLIDLGMV